MDKTFVRSIMTVFLSLMLAVSMMPVGVFAAGDLTSGAAGVEETVIDESSDSTQNEQSDNTGSDDSQSEEGGIADANDNDNDNDAEDNSDSDGQISDKNEAEPTENNEEQSAGMLRGAADDADDEGGTDSTDNDDQPDDAEEPEGDGSSLHVTVNGQDVEGRQFSMVADRTITMNIIAKLPQASGDKKITVDIPTGWVVVRYSRLDTDADHSITIPSTTMGEEVQAGMQWKIDDAYKDAIKSVTLEPNLSESKYGTVVSSDNTWETQSLDGWGTEPKARTFGGKLTYELKPHASNATLVVTLRPQPYLYPRVTGTEDIPSPKVTLITQTEEDEEPVEKTASMNVSTSVPRLGLTEPWSNYSKNTDITSEISKAHFMIAGSMTHHDAVTSPRTSRSLADEYTYTMTYPEGVFYSDDQKGGLIPGDITIDEDPDDGGGTITITGNNRVIAHSGGSANAFRIYFDAKTGADFKPDCEKVYCSSQNPESIQFPVTQTIIRCGERKENSLNLSHKIYDKDAGSGYLISLGSINDNRRDLAADFGMDDYDIMLTNVTLKSEYVNEGVPFHFVNQDNKLGITGIRMPGKDIRDLVIKTFRTDGSAGRTIELTDSYGPKDSGQYNSHMIAGKEIGLEEDEYISEVYLKADLLDYSYNDGYLYGGIGFIGRYIDNTAGRVDISVVQLKEDGEYTEEAALNPETGSPITGYAGATPAAGGVGAGWFYTNVSKEQGGAHDSAYYPNDSMMYFTSTMTNTGATLNRQNTVIDPTITIALPEGLELNTSSVQGRSAAGNHKNNEWFGLVPAGPVRQVEIDGVMWNCYDYTSEKTLDMVANEQSTNAKGNYGGTVTDAERQLAVRFNALISTTCQQYDLNTTDCVLWYLGDGTVSATSGESWVFTDTDNRMGRGTNAKYAAGKHGFQIKPLVGLGYDLDIRAYETPETDWTTWAGGDNTVVTVHEGKPAQVRLSYISKAATDSFADTTMYLPIPKQGEEYEYLNNTELADPLEAKDNKAFGFTAHLTGPIEMDGNMTEWETWYATSARTNAVTYDKVPEAESDSWEPVIANWTQNPSNYEDVVLVKFVAKDNIPPDDTGEAVFDLTVDPNAPFDSFDYWRGYGKARLGDTQSNWQYTPVIAATPSSATFLGQIFVDDLDFNAAFDDTESGYGSGYEATVARDDGSIAPWNVIIGSDGSMNIVADEQGRPVYLRKGDYTLTVTKSDEDTDYEKIESGSKSTEEKWYNNVKNGDISGAKAQIHFTVDKSVEIRRGNENVIPVVYREGVGLVKLNDFTFTKLGENDNGQTAALAGAKFKLYKDTDCSIPAEREGNVYEATSDSDGNVNFNDILAGTYYMKETDLPSGSEAKYYNNTTSYKVVVDNNAKVEITRTAVNPNTGETSGSQESGYSVINRQKTGLSISKIWNDGDNADGTRTKSISIDITGIAEGVNVVAKTVKVVFEGTAGEDEILASKDDSGKWNFEVEGLKKFENGKKIIYSIAEKAIARYTAKHEGDADSGFTVTNTETTTVSVEKKWVGPEDKAHPEVTVNLLKNGSKADSVKLSDTAGLTHTFGEDGSLPAYDENGAAVTYTVEEEKLTGFKTEISGSKADDGTYAYTITNTYAAEGTLKLGGLKKLNVASGKLVAGQFTFKVTDNGKEIATGTNAADGSITFTPKTVTYRYDNDNDDRGVHKIVISETGADGSGATADAEDLKVDVTVTDQGNGKLKVTPADITDKVTMTNSYEAKGDITFSGKVSISNGRKIDEGEVFRFTVKEGDEVVAIGESDADGNITFTKISYLLNKDTDNTGSHTYTVTEDAYDSKGVKSISESYEVTVAVSDNGNGTLKVTPSENYSALDFVNSYEAEGETAIEAGKVIENRAFQEGDEWTFTIEGSDGAPLPVDENGEEISSVTINPTEGSSTAIDFGTFRFDFGDLDNTAYTEKTFSYTITESGDIAGVVNDADADRVVKIKVSDDGSGELAAELAEDSEEVKFTNTYETKGSITFSGIKTLKGAEIRKGQFEFELYDADNNLIESVWNAEDGSYSFTELRFTGDDLDRDWKGNFKKTTKKYRVVEKKGTDSHITYDEREYRITATLTDDTYGAIEVTADPAEYTYDFENTYTPDAPPADGNPEKPGNPDKGVKTGDDTGIGLWLALLFAAASGLTGTALYRRRREE